MGGSVLDAPADPVAPGSVLLSACPPIVDNSSMTDPPNYSGDRLLPEIIAQAVWLFHGFALSLLDVEGLLTTRSIAVPYESIRVGLQFHTR